MITQSSIGLAIGLALAGFQAQRDPMSPPLHVDLPEEGTTLPLLPGEGLPRVDVFIAESGPFPCVVEWAGNVFAVSEKVANACELATIAKTQDGSAVVEVPELRVGEAGMHGLIAEAVPYLEEAGFEGILGLNVFANVTGCLDFRAKTLSLSSDPLPDPKKDDSVLAYSPGPGGAPRVPLRLGEARFQAVLDTAAEELLIIDDRLIDKLQIEGELEPGPRVFTPDTGEIETRMGTLAGELVAGKVRLSKPRAMFHRMAEPEVLLGGAFLAEHELWLDQRNKRLRLRRAPKKEEAPAAAR